MQITDVSKVAQPANPQPNPRGPKHHISCPLCYLFILQYSSTSRGVKLPSKSIIANNRIKFKVCYPIRLNVTGHVTMLKKRDGARHDFEKLWQGQISPIKTNQHCKGLFDRQLRTSLMVWTVVLLYSRF